MRPSRYNRVNWIPLATHVLITLVVIIMGLVVVPQWYTLVQINKLTASSMQDREEGLNFLIRNAGDDQRVLRKAVRCLDIPDTVNFLQIVNALDLAGQWRRPVIPDHTWLRWLGLASKDSVVESRDKTARALAKLTDLADDPQVVSLAKRLINDTSEEVRYQALITTAQLCNAAIQRDAYKNLMVHATSDPSSEIARHAWIFLGWLKASGDIRAKWRTVPPSVARAMLWAWAKTNPQQLAPCLDAANDPTVNPTVQAMAVYCLSMGSPEQVAPTLNQKIKQSIEINNNVDSQLVAWRATLVLGAWGQEYSEQADPLHELLAACLNNPKSENGHEPILLSAIYSGLLQLNDQQRKIFSRTNTVATPVSSLVRLAWLEGLPVGEHKIDINSDTPDMLRLATVAVTKDPQLDDLRPLFEHEVATIRDLACIVAKDRFTPQQLDGTVNSLLNNFNDNAKCSGAILAGLTGLQTPLLIKKARDEDIWWVQQIIKLGMWMQGQFPEMEMLAPGLLTRDDLPSTTVLLSMLHRGHPHAWEYFFDPRSEPQIDLIELFDQHRWWLVFERDLPDRFRKDLKFWFWADPDLEAFQIDLIRSWYALHNP